MYEVGKYRIKEVTTNGDSRFYPQKLLRSFWFTYHWVYYLHDNETVWSATKVSCHLFIQKNAKKPGVKREVTYHNVEI